MNKLISFIVMCFCLLPLGCKETINETIVVGLESLTDPRIKPKVISTNPPMNSEGPYENFGTALEVRFNKIMNYRTLRHAFYLSSPSGDVRADTNVYPSKEDDSYTIVPKRIDGSSAFRWRLGQNYLLIIDTTAQDVNGNSLRPEFRMTFKPEPYFRVRNIYPRSDEIDIYLGSIISLSFNSNVDTSIFSSIHIDLPITGEWEFQSRTTNIDSAYIYFDSDDELSTNTRYTITIDDSAHDTEGNILIHGFTSSFTTASFRVISTYPYDGSQNLRPRNPYINVQFNEMLDTSTIRNSFRVAPMLDGSVRVGENGRYFTFSPLYSLSPSTTYAVTIDTTIRSKSGARLAEPYHFSFTTEKFRVESTSPRNGETDFYGNTRVAIAFNAEIDTGSVRTAFTITPIVQGLFNFDYSGVFYFSPIIPLPVSTSFTVTISAAMRARGGTPLDEAYTFSFQTAPFKVITSNPPNGFTNVPRSTTITFGFTYLIDTLNASRAFSISPQVEGRFLFPPQLAAFIYSPNEPLAPYTIYTVTLDTTLSSISGDRLRTPYRLEFATGN